MASAGQQVTPTDVGRFSKNFLSCVSFPLYIQILSCSTLLQFIRVSVPFQAPVENSLRGIGLNPLKYQVAFIHPLTFFSLLLQAILFYVPRWLWKNWEAGKVAALRMDLNLGIISEVEKKLKKKLLIEYMYSNLKHHNFWAYRYFFCELLALVNVGGKISFLLS